MIFKYYKNKVKQFLKKNRIKIFKKFFDKKISLEFDKENFLLNNNIKTILFFNKTGKIGDMVVASFIFREIKKRYQNIGIDIVARGNGKDILKNNHNIRNIYNYDKKNLVKLAKNLKNNKYDLVVTMLGELKEYDYIFVKNCKSKFCAGINQKNWKLFDISIDENIDFDHKTHITSIYSLLLNRLGIKNNIDKSYEMFFDTARLEKIDHLKSKYKNKLAVINPYGAGINRQFNEKTMNFFINELNKKEYTVIILYFGDKIHEVQKYEKFKNVMIPKNIKNILDSSMYIFISNLVITPDTGIVHIASAFDKKILAIYQYPKTQLDVWNDYIIWAPNTKEKSVMIFPNGYLSKYEIDNDSLDINNLDFEELKLGIGSIL